MKLFDMNWNNDHDVYLDNDKNKIIEVTNYNEKQIRIDTYNLEIGNTYSTKTSKPIESCSFDEHLFTYGYTEDTQTFAISLSDQNDIEKTYAEIYKRECNLESFDFKTEEKEGTKAVSFYLIDKDYRYIYIAAAWIWNIYDHMRDYECSSEIFTWIV